MTGLRAGTSALPLEPPLGLPMMGYGARTGTATSTLDPLMARALYLCGSGRVLWIACDLCLLAPSQADEVRRRVSDETGLERSEIVVGCIHTHSGPDTGLLQLLTGGAAPAHVAPLLDRIVESGVRAHAEARPARLGVGRGAVGIGRNRRRAGGPVDPTLLVVRVDGLEGRPLALFYVHGCHATALGHDNLAWSADWPGAAARLLAQTWPGVNPIFALGAHADVDPRTRGLLDLAVPDQSRGVDPGTMEALGREVGEAVAEAAERIPTSADAPVGIRSARVRLRAHPEGEDPQARAKCLAEERAAALAALELPADAEPGVAELYRLEHPRTAHLPAEDRRERIARVRRYLRDLTAAAFAGGPEAEVEVQRLRLGEADLLAMPLEPTVAVGEAWRRRVGSPSAAVLGIANGWLRYLPHASEFAEPDANHKYEVLQSTFGPEAAERLLAAGAALGLPGREGQAA